MLTNNQIIDPSSFIKPVGYNIFISQGAKGTLIKVDPEAFAVNPNTYAALVSLKNQGWFNPEENEIVFSYGFNPEKPLVGFSVRLGDVARRQKTWLKIGVGRKTQVLASEKSAGFKLIHEILLDDLPNALHKRFTDYDLTLANGWNTMHYLDYATGWKHVWTKDTIQAFDELVTQGLSLNEIWRQTDYNVPAEHMLNSVSLPGSWLEKAYGKKD